jgi:uncharacterized protein (TIGR03000 family)
MYSIVLAMALSNGAATPAYHPGDGSLSGYRYGEYGHQQYRHRRGGCCGCSGGCYGGCRGGGYGGCSGGCYGGCWGGTYMMPVPRTGTGGTREKIEKPPKEGGKEEETHLPAPATIVVSLPADATLTIDDAATKSTSATRVFASPDLPPDKEFHYTLKAQITRNGEKLATTQKVTVRAGQETYVTLEFPTTSVAQK